MYTAYVFAVLISQYIIAGNRDAQRRRMSLPITANEDDLPGSTLVCSTFFVDYPREVNNCPSLNKNNTDLIASQPVPYTRGMKAEALRHG